MDIVHHKRMKTKKAMDLKLQGKIPMRKKIRLKRFTKVNFNPSDDSIWWAFFCD